MAYVDEKLAGASLDASIPQSPPQASRKDRFLRLGGLTFILLNLAFLSYGSYGRPALLRPKAIEPLDLLASSSNAILQPVVVINDVGLRETVDRSPLARPSGEGRLVLNKRSSKQSRKRGGKDRHGRRRRRRQGCKKAPTSSEANVKTLPPVTTDDGSDDANTSLVQTTNNNNGGGRSSTRKPSSSSKKPSSSTRKPSSSTKAGTSSTKPATTTGSGSGAAGGDDTGSDTAPMSAADQAAALSIHNNFRKQYGAGALTWSNTLADKALEWGKKCVWEHSQGALGPYGENLSKGAPTESIQQGIKLWTDEAGDYDPNNPTFSHFTQMVWKATTQLGCAKVQCGGKLFPGYSTSDLIVCEYFPAGNVQGGYAKNVGAHI